MICGTVPALCSACSQCVRKIVKIPVDLPKSLTRNSDIGSVWELAKAVNGRQSIGAKLAPAEEKFFTFY